MYVRKPPFHSHSGIPHCVGRLTPGDMNKFVLETGGASRDNFQYINYRRTRSAVALHPSAEALCSLIQWAGIRIATMVYCVVIAIFQWGWQFDIYYDNK